ncbi:MAG TPA: c-type cytochrome [Bacteroidota bacterium]|nr:c-type cytochrome [Bacteroidota bacterium]
MIRSKGGSLAILGIVALFLSHLLQAQPSLDLGKEIYMARCSMCHGTDGKGDGAPSRALNPKPRDFTSGKFKFRSTESGSIPTDDDLVRTVQSGLHGTSMIDWGALMSDDSIRAVIAYLKTFSRRFTNEKPKPVRVGTAIPSSKASIAAGKRVYEKLQCAKCHGDDGTGANAIQKEFTDDWGEPIRATSLTEPWAFRGGVTARDVYLRFRTGIDGTPMPSYKGSASDEEMWHLANYVLSLARKPVWAMSEQELKAFYDSQREWARNNPVAWGKYLVETKGCGDCHSPIREDGSMVRNLHLAGGQKWEVKPYATLYTANLTPDKETGIGALTDDQLRLAITRGIRRDGTRMLPFPMPWPSYASMSEEDVKAILAYLRSMPPIKNQIPERETPNIFSYLILKFRMLILKEGFPAFIYPGNAGMAQAGKEEQQ